MNKNNLQTTVQQLLSHLVKPDSALAATRTAAESLANAATATKETPPSSSPAQSSTSYRTVLAQRILTMCGEDLYARVEDFEWYVSVLVDLAYVARAPVGAMIRDQLVDITVRVRQVRRYAMQLCMRVLGDETFLSGSSNGTDAEGTGCQEILWAAAWICGEYSELVCHGSILCRIWFTVAFTREFSDTRKVIPSLLSLDPSALPSDTVAVYLQSAAKIFGAWAADLATRWDEDDLPEVKEQVEFIISKLRVFAGSPDFEVQERVSRAITDIISHIH